MKLGEVMKRDLVVVDEKTKVSEVCKIMGEKRIGSVLVSRNGEIYGIFTERDLLSKVFPDNGLEREVGRYATTPLITVSPDYSVREAAKIMAEMKIRRLVVVEEGKVTGIFTASDLVEVLAKHPELMR